jgi:hypothetical protein
MKAAILRPEESGPFTRGHAPGPRASEPGHAAAAQDDVAHETERVGKVLLVKLSVRIGKPIDALKYILRGVGVRWGAWVGG